MSFIKTKYTFAQIGQRLEVFKQPFNVEDIPYLLLGSIGVSDTLIQRYKERKNVVASFDGLLIKGIFAYQYVATEQLASSIDKIKNDPLIIKNKPSIVAVCDGATIRAYDTSIHESYENSVDKLYTDYEFFSPMWGVKKIRNIEENEADIKAAYVMASIHDEIRRYNGIGVTDDTHDLNIFMSRLLFCFFAEDTGIFESNIFTNTIRETTQKNGSDLPDFFDGAFAIMDIPDSKRSEVNKRYSQFPYVDGSLFEKRITIPRMNFKIRKLILECGDLNWSKINPDIFGSMIQAVINPELRGGLGIHYTSVSNILKVIKPLFLDELYDEYYKLDRKKKEQDCLFDNTTKKGSGYFDACKPIMNGCKQLLLRMSKMKFFDPACGSGNFLIITYKQLRIIESLTLKLMQQMTHELILDFIYGSAIKIDQFYGIEINDFAHDTAKLSLWLAEHQMNNSFKEDFGVIIDALPLKQNHNIICGNSCRLNWDEVCPHNPDDEVYIMGNPPYLGSKLQSKEQKRDIIETFKNMKNCKILDYISCWFDLASIYIQNTNAQFAFVSTNSICQGEQVSILWPLIFNRKQKISFAYTSFKWTNNAKYNAGVTCVIIGICNKVTNKSQKIYSGISCRDVNSISPYLTSSTETIVYKNSKKPNGLPKICFGCMAYDNGALLMDEYTKNKLLADYPEANEIIRTIYGSAEYIRGNKRYCLWINDNQVDLAKSIPPISERIERTRLSRLNSKDNGGKKLAEKPYQFREHVEDMEKIIIPRVSSERRQYIPIGYLDKKSIISDSAFAVYDAPLYLFGILTSAMHMTWVKAIGGRLKTDYRYSAQLCYNTFPFPPLTDSKKSEIEEAAKNVLMVRENHYEKTMAELYDPNKMPTDLKIAHHDLDIIVDSCYANVPFINDNERLECLFKLYEQMKNKKLKQ